MRLVALLLAALPLAGCFSTTVSDLGGGAFRLETSYDSFNRPISAAQYALDDQASERCAGGYEKTAEATVVRAGDRYLAWDVRCR